MAKRVTRKSARRLTEKKIASLEEKIERRRAEIERDQEELRQLNIQVEEQKIADAEEAGRKLYDLYKENGWGVFDAKEAQKIHGFCVENGYFEDKEDAPEDKEETVEGEPAADETAIRELEETPEIGYRTIGYEDAGDVYAEE